MDKVVIVGGDTSLGFALLKMIDSLDIFVFLYNFKKFDKSQLDGIKPLTLIDWEGKTASFTHSILRQANHIVIIPPVPPNNEHKVLHILKSIVDAQASGKISLISQLFVFKAQSLFPVYESSWRDINFSPAQTYIELENRVIKQAPINSIAILRIPLLYGGYPYLTPLDEVIFSEKEVIKFPGLGISKYPHLSVEECARIVIESLFFEELTIVNIVPPQITNSEFLKIIRPNLPYEEDRSGIQSMLSTKRRILIRELTISRDYSTEIFDLFFENHVWIPHDTYAIKIHEREL